MAISKAASESVSPISAHHNQASRPFSIAPLFLVVAMAYAPTLLLSENPARTLGAIGAFFSIFVFPGTLIALLLSRHQREKWKPASLAFCFSPVITGFALWLFFIASDLTPSDIAYWPLFCVGAVSSLLVLKAISNFRLTGEARELSLIIACLLTAMLFGGVGASLTSVDSIGNLHIAFSDWPFHLAIIHLSMYEIPPPIPSAAYADLQYHYLPHLIAAVTAYASGLSVLEIWKVILPWCMLSAFLGILLLFSVSQMRLEIKSFAIAIVSYFFLGSHADASFLLNDLVQSLIDGESPWQNGVARANVLRWSALAGTSDAFALGLVPALLAGTVTWVGSPRKTTLVSAATALLICFSLIGFAAPLGVTWLLAIAVYHLWLCIRNNENISVRNVTGVVGLVGACAILASVGWRIFSPNGVGISLSLMSEPAMGSKLIDLAVFYIFGFGFLLVGLLPLLSGSAQKGRFEAIVFSTILVGGWSLAFALFNAPGSAEFHFKAYIGSVVLALSALGFALLLRGRGSTFGRQWQWRSGAILVIGFALLPSVNLSMITKISAILGLVGLSAGIFSLASERRRFMLWILFVGGALSGVGAVAKIATGRDGIIVDGGSVALLSRLEDLSLSARERLLIFRDRATSIPSCGVPSEIDFVPQMLSGRASVGDNARFGAVWLGERESTIFFEVREHLEGAISGAFNEYDFSRVLRQAGYRVDGQRILGVADSTLVSRLKATLPSFREVESSTCVTAFTFLLDGG